MKVLLSTLNSKFIHSSLALRYLQVYGKTRGFVYERAEYTINQPILDILSDITEKDFQVVGFACYIWNIEMTLHLVSLLKSVRPDIIIILGGPEVSYNAVDVLNREPAIDYILQGEGEIAFSDFMEALEQKKSPLVPAIPGIIGRDHADGQIKGSDEVVEVPDLSIIPFAYTEEDMQDLDHKIIYYESSRGCPFNCKYCLSGNRNTVRFFPLERTLQELQWFIDHKVKQVKFVDRTFNCAAHHHLPIMNFIKDADTKTNFHLEMEAALIGEEEVEILSTSPKGRMQIEVGVQSTHLPTLAAITRNDDWPHIQEVIPPIIKAGRTHVHMDLIVGLPEEDKETFGKSFNDLFSIQPHALQLGFLKLLRGSGVTNMPQYEYVCNPKAPYEVLSTHVLPYDDVRYLKHFEDVFECFYNSEHYRTVFAYVGQQLIDHQESAFHYFCDMTDKWLADGNHLVKLNDKSQIIFLYNFFISKGDKLAGELLRYDTLRAFKGKVRPTEIGIPAQTKELLRDSEDFWRNKEAVAQFLPNYDFKEWRRIRQDYCEMNISEKALAWLQPNTEALAYYQEHKMELGYVDEYTPYIPIVIDTTGIEQTFVRPDVININKHN